MPTEINSSVEVLTAHTNDELLVQQALKFNPNIVVIGDDKKYSKVQEALQNRYKSFARNSLDDVAAMDCYDVMIATVSLMTMLPDDTHNARNGKPLR